MTRPFHDVPPIVQAAPPIGGRRVALVIGNDAYRHTNRLSNAANDARAMTTALEALGFEIVGGVRDGVDLTYGGMAERVRDFGRCLASDVETALLFYAGHGLQVAGRNYLVPVDAELQVEADVNLELLELQSILNQMERPGRNSIVLLDACRNNPLAKNLARAMGLGGTRAAGIVEGLAEQKVVAGSLIAYATHPGHVAFDGEKGANGYFTDALLACIATPDRDVELMLKDVRARVVAATQKLRNGPQIPWVHSSLMGDFYFKRTPTAPVEPPSAPPSHHTPPVDDRTVEHTFWQSIQASTDPAEFIVFLEKFPAGTFAALAFERAKTLIEATQQPNVLRRMLSRYPESKLAPRLRRRLAALDWPQMRKSKDAAALEVFVSEVQGQPEAELARQRIGELARDKPSAAGSSSISQPLLLRPAIYLGVGLFTTIGILVLQSPYPLVVRSKTAEKSLPLKDQHRMTSRRFKDEQFFSALALAVSDKTPDAERVASLVNLLKAYPDYKPEIWKAGISLKPPIELVEVERGQGLGKQWVQAGVGNPFWDCDQRLKWCPQMTALPKGTYQRGSPDNETGRNSDEGPVHEVTIGYHFAISQFEVTFDQWDACFADGKCKHKPKTNWGRGRQPVHSVSWNDITNEFLPWLNGKLRLSGDMAYRLLTEAEWEYAARATTTTPFWFGPLIRPELANFDGNHLEGWSAAGVYRRKTIEVGSLNMPNAWSLHDMHGNVREWVEDAYAVTYDGAQRNGSPRETQNSDIVRVIRGGGWSSKPQNLRSAGRSWNLPDIRHDDVGFRLARTLNP
jgi:formylglycine-generating enzyme required for sulfatase activity